MKYYLDYDGISILVPKELLNIALVRYVNTREITHKDIKALTIYIAWRGYLHKEFRFLKFITTPSFQEWMYSPYTTEESDYALNSPPIPRIILASAAIYPSSGGLDLLRSRQGRAHLLSWFFSMFPHFFPNEKWPDHLMYAFLPTSEDPLPLMLQAFRDDNENIRKNFPCRDEAEKAHYILWTIRNSESLYPSSTPPAAVVTWLHSPSIQNTGEGLSRAFAGISREKDACLDYSLDTSLDRLRFVASVLLHRRDIHVSPWQWKELSKPFEAAPAITKHMAGLAMQLGISKAQLIDKAYQRNIFGLYLRHALPLIKRFGLPDWLKIFLFKPAHDFDGAKKFGLSELMACLAISTPGAPPLKEDKNEISQLVHWYLHNDLELPVDLFVVHWQLIAWSATSVCNIDTIPTAAHVFLDARQFPTITVHGWANVSSGVGEDCRNMHAALTTNGATNIHLNDISSLVPPASNCSQVVRPISPMGFINIICLAAQDIYRLKMQTTADWWVGRFNIGFCPWELPEYPKTAFFTIENLQEIWTPSMFTAKAFAFSGKPVTYIPNAVIPPVSDGDLRNDLCIKKDTIIFLTAFDANASYVRKNPLAVLKSFNRAFANIKADVKLIVKTMNSANQTLAWKEVLSINECSDKVLFIDETFPKDRHARLLNTCDAFVSLHRSEGFGRLLAEAMSLGKLLIASNFGGSTDFATPETACLVSGRLVDVESGQYLFAEGQQWFEADIEHAAQYMRDFADNPARFSTLAENGKKHVLANHSLKAVSKRAYDALAKSGLV